MVKRETNNNGTLQNPQHFCLHFCLILVDPRGKTVCRGGDIEKIIYDFEIYIQENIALKDSQSMVVSMPTSNII